MHDDPHEIERMHERIAILEAMLAVTSQRDELIHVVGEARSAEVARQNVMDRFGFTEVQAVAVLDLQIRRFARLERGRIADEAESLRRLLDRP